MNICIPKHWAVPSHDNYCMCDGTKGSHYYCLVLERNKKDFLVQERATAGLIFHQLANFVCILHLTLNNVKLAIFL